MATFLLQHSYGRVLLHIIAMTVDGQISWHCAGIVREITPSHECVPRAEE